MYENMFFMIKKLYFTILLKQSRQAIRSVRQTKRGMLETQNN